MISLTHDTRPVPWSRSVRGDRSKRRLKQDKYIADLAMMLKIAAEGETFDGAVQAELRFDYKTSQTLIRLTDASWRPDLKITRGDCDNLVKMVLESVEKSGIVKDDAQIAWIIAEKVR